MIKWRYLQNSQFKTHDTKVVPDFVAEQPIAYGGQAVVEGVMFQGQYSLVTAVRRKSGAIETFEVQKKEQPILSKVKKIPFIRGLIGLIEASASGAKHLQFATEQYDLDENPEQVHDTKETFSSKLSMWLGVAVVGILSFIVGKVIFTLVPAMLASFLFDGFVTNLILQNLIEGAIKTILLFSYLWIISQTPIIKRVFQYHGAEHKVITAYEHGEELTVENVQKHSRLHYRCGSSFMILTILVGVIVYSFFQYDDMWDRMIIRLELLPVVIMLSYEVLRFTNALRDVPVLKYLGYPGLWLQLLTTKEPNDEQVEVAITSFKRMLDLDSEVKAKQAPLNHASSIEM